MKVLLRVDIQRDFCAGGHLAVPDGDAVVEVANRLSQSGDYDRIVDSQDHHPPDHGSFASQHPGMQPFADRIELNGVPQQLWPDHCVEGTPGCAFHPDLDRSKVAITIQKGRDARVDSYSAFFDNGRQAPADVRQRYPFLGQSTGLAEWLEQQCNDPADLEIHVIGLALDYCVSATAKDAASLGYPTTVIQDGCRAIGAVPAALAELRAAGVHIA